MRRVPSATRSDSVRHPIGFRSPSNQIASATRSDSVRCTMVKVLKKADVLAAKRS